MTINISGVNNALFQQSPPRRVAPEISPVNQSQASSQTQSTVLNRNVVESSRVFTPEQLSPAPANRALGEYLSVQNNEKREQVSQLFGLDIYA